MKNYRSRFTLPGQPHQGKENTSEERLLASLVNYYSSLFLSDD